VTTLSGTVTRTLGGTSAATLPGTAAGTLVEEVSLISLQHSMAISERSAMIRALMIVRGEIINQVSSRLFDVKSIGD
jgi:hypothetical protein